MVLVLTHPQFYIWAVFKNMRGRFSTGWGIPLDCDYPQYTG